MSENQIAGCYFPTTVLFVDDRPDHLESLKILIDKMMLYRFYTEPDKALEWLQNDNASSAFAQPWMTHSHEESHHQDCDNHAFIDIDLSSIHKEIYSAQRFKEVSVIVVDYAMPKMNGLEFSRLLKNSPKHNAIKILMLTGQADYAFGVEALNEGTIDYFITKGETVGFKQKLNDAIKKLQLQYFVDRTKPLIQNLITNPSFELKNKAYLSLFKKIKTENKIIEHYLINDKGSFLMFDFEGNPSWLIVKSEKDMETSYQCLVDNDLPEEITTPIKNRTKLLFFFNNKDKIMASNKEWQHYLHPATPFSEGHYYSFIQGKSAYDIDLKKIVSYRKFLEAT